MNKKITAILAFILILSGCTTIPDQIPEELRTIQQTGYVARIPPKELLTLPPRPTAIDTDTADQATVALWIVQREKYILELERLLIGIADFFVDEQNKLDQHAASINAKQRAESAGEQ